MNDTPETESVKRLVLPGGRLILYGDGHTELRSATDAILPDSDRDKAITYSQTQAHAWLLQAAAQRNESEDPIVALLKSDTVEVIDRTLRDLLPHLFNDAPPFPGNAPPGFAERPIFEPSLGLSGDRFAGLTRKRLAHQAWAARWRNARERIEKHAAIIDAYRAFIRKTTRALPGGPATAVTEILARIDWLAGRQDLSGPPVGRRETMCIWSLDSAKAQIFHDTTVPALVWAVAMKGTVPVGLKRRSPLDREAITRLRREHAATLCLVTRIALEVLPAGTTIHWRGAHRETSAGIANAAPPIHILSASIAASQFEADEPTLLGAIKGGVTPALPWLQWHATNSSATETDDKR